MFFLPYLIALVGLGLLEVGLTVTGLVVIAVALVVVHFREAITAHLERGPAVEVIEHREEGLPDREVQEFNVLHNEYKKIQDEKRKEMERKARKQGKAGGQSLNTK